MYMFLNIKICNLRYTEHYMQCHAHTQEHTHWHELIHINMDMNSYAHTDINLISPLAYTKKKAPLHSNIDISPFFILSEVWALRWSVLRPQRLSWVLMNTKWSVPVHPAKSLWKCNPLTRDWSSLSQKLGDLTETPV